MYLSSHGRESVQDVTVADIIDYIPELAKDYMHTGNALSILRDFGTCPYEKGLTCRKETAEAVVTGKGDYLLAAKGNQAALEHEIRDYVQDESLRKTMDCKSVTEKSRDRIETGTAYTTVDIDWLYGKEKREKLCCIGAIKTEFERKGTKTEERHYDISSRNLTAPELLHHARMEWAVESMHWLLDVHFSEDYCRIVNRTIQLNLNMLRKFVLSLLKQLKASSHFKRPVSQIMFNCLLDPPAISAILEN